MLIQDRLRVGPELEISGYGLLGKASPLRLIKACILTLADHFKEQDTFLHSLEMLCRILSDKSCYGIIIDVGMAIQFHSVAYNCRVICLDGKILLIRPKRYLANDGNYREQRYFQAWAHERGSQQYPLPRMLQKLQGASHVPIGVRSTSFYEFLILILL